MKFNVYIIYLLLCAIFIHGCRTNLVPVTQRKLDLIEEGVIHERVREVEPEVKPPEIFVIEKNIKIEKVLEDQNSGSIYRIDDPRNNLLTESPRGILGEFLEFKVASNKSNPAEIASPDKKAKKDLPDPKAKPAEPPKDKEVEDALKLEEDLLRALPDLDGGKNNPMILQSIKMKVALILPNGDALVVHARESKNENDSNYIVTKARVPVAALQAKRPLTTNDLYDVEWSESNEGAIQTRKSLAWEDEYSLRLSGFSEARSRAAIELEEKRKQMKGIKSQVETNLKSLTANRVKMAQERQLLARERLDMKRKSQELSDTIKQREDTIESQKRDLETAAKEKKELEEEFARAQKESDGGSEKSKAKSAGGAKAAAKPAKPGKKQGDEEKNDSAEN